MRRFTMIATSVCIAASFQGGFAYAEEATGHRAFDALAATVASPPSKRVSPWLVVAQQEAGSNDEGKYRYRPEGRRDPFESLVQEDKPEGPLSPYLDRGERPREPLERFDISALKLVGILWGELGWRALIRAPDNKGYFVTVGTYMGQKGGQVIEIAKDRLVLEEKYKDTEGNIVGKTLTLPLRRKEKKQS